MALHNTQHLHTCCVLLVPGQSPELVLSFEESIRFRALLPFPKELTWEAVRLEDNSETNASHSLITKMTDELYHHVPENHCVLKDLDHLPTETWPQLLRELCSTPFPTLFCPRIVLEVLVVFQSISKQCHHVSCLGAETQAVGGEDAAVSPAAELPAYVE
uniref:endoplasmic reticulum membrane-associated RNA degradation protein-like n=1 Tax=Macaca mulatta TaxID=9544 RepID=UPI0010A22D57|nr:endoplasmic reticulum membrane-associated RNA degradation protein-like [Macaca mulatta]